VFEEASAKLMDGDTEGYLRIIAEGTVRPNRLDAGRGDP